MDYEEKYKNALERARKIHNETEFDYEKGMMEEVFPELTESEDEKIRKAIICGMYALKEQRRIYFASIFIDDAIAWLEKQGKKLRGKSVLEAAKEEKIEDGNKVESRFKIGDWVVFNNNHESIYQIEKKENFQYTIRHILGGSMPLSFGSENMIRLWTVKDIKDGDVISNGEMIVIFKHWEDPSYRQHIIAYIGLNINGDIQITDDNWSLGINKAKPATKEQRDILFSKMKEAGYEWDANKKELKKIIIEPRFKVGDWVCNGGGNPCKVNYIFGNCYELCSIEDYSYYKIISDIDANYHLWTIADAKPGDVLAAHECYVIFKKIYGLNIKCYCTYHYMNNPSFHVDTLQNKDAFHPATKEQRDTLMKAMADDGYTFDFEKKELKKVEEEINDEDYGIDGLWHAQRILERTLGEVDGYQSDDGILEHKCAISAVKKLYEQKPVWSEEDEKKLIKVISIVQNVSSYDNQLDEYIEWLKSIKQKIGG